MKYSAYAINPDGILVYTGLPVGPNSNYSFEDHQNRRREYEVWGIILNPIGETYLRHGMGGDARDHFSFITINKCLRAFEL